MLRPFETGFAPAKTTLPDPESGSDLDPGSKKHAGPPSTVEPPDPPPESRATPLLAPLLQPPSGTPAQASAYALPGPPPGRPPEQAAHALQTSVASNAAALSELFAGYARQPAPLAVVSGGSIAGFSAALELAARGYQVVVVEERTFYTRANVLSLKTDAVLYWAALSPDGALLQQLMQQRLVSRYEREIRPAEGDSPRFQASVNPSHRFLDWLLPQAALPPLIPVRERRCDLLTLQQDLAGFHETLPRETAGGLVEALDPAWPGNEPVSAATPETWRLPQARFFQSDNLLLARTNDLEKGLNTHCVNHPNIRVLQARLRLDRREDGDSQVTFLLQAPGGPETFQPAAPPDLVCIAEGANSRSRGVIGGELPAVDTNESWRQGNYTGAPSTLGGFNAVEVDGGEITATQHIEGADASLVNVTVYHPTSAVPDAATLIEKLQRAQAHVAAGRSGVVLDEQHRVYDSGQIDIRLRMARAPMDHNTILVGDAAFSGSPVGGYGGSVAASEFARLVGDTVAHPLFGSRDPAERRRLEDFYRQRVADLWMVRGGRPTDLMFRLGFYSQDTYIAYVRQAAQARFAGLSPLPGPNDDDGDAPAGDEEQR